MLKRCRPALGTFVEVTILDEADGPDAVRAVDAAYAAIDRVMRRMSFHDPASDLSTINRDAVTRTVSVDPWTMDVLESARDLFHATGGRFDCSVGSLLVRHGLLPRQTGFSTDASADFDDVELDRRTDSVRFRRPLCLDLGGIAKGFAVDRAIDALRARGVERAVVNAGGDLRVLGTQSVPIHVRGPDDGPPIRVGDLADGAFATSAGDLAGRRSRTPGALVDAPARRLIDHARGVYAVVAPTCLVADALTKVLACGGAEADDLLRSYGAAAIAC